jgi:hypothetical protein
LTEVNYFKREFGIKIESVESITEFESKLSSVNYTTLLIASTNPEYWIESLNKLRKNTVIFFLLGNETYEPNDFNSLNKISSLKHAFVYNPPNKVLNGAILGGIIGNIIDGGLKHTESHGSVYRDGRISYSLKNKFKKIDMRYPFSFLPQGYSNSFANKITKLAKLDETDSLISQISTAKIHDLKSIHHKFSFIGQQGIRRREVFLRAAEKFNDVKIYPPEAGFGGNNGGDDYTYVNHLLNSRYILVPPGNFNNFNHRYTESLICHSLPVILANNSIDPSRNDNWTKKLTYLRRYSVKSQMKYLEKINDETFEKYYSLASSNDFKKILDTKTLIYSLLGKIDHSSEFELAKKSQESAYKEMAQLREITGKMHKLIRDLGKRSK